MEDFITWQRKIYPLSDDAIRLLMEDMEEVIFRKGELPVCEGKRSNYAYFMKEGFARAYIVRDGRDLTLWFASQGEMLSETGGRISVISVEMAENSVLLKIPCQKLESLFEHSAELANWGRKLMEFYLQGYEHYFMNYYWTDARTQYETLLKEYPTLLQKIPLKHIASYLQITPQSLSRIRARKD